MALQDKYAAARTILDEHNQAMMPAQTSQDRDKKPAGYIDPDTFLSQLKMAGGTSEDRLKGMSFEDIMAIMPVPVPLPGMEPVRPVALAKDIAKVFRGKDDAKTPTGDGSRPYYSPKKVGAMSPQDLVAAFDPEEPDNAVAQRLKTGSNGNAFLVYTSPGSRTVDTANSLMLYLELRKGYTSRESLIVGSEIRKVYRVGELPNDLVDENPLYRGRPLRPDNTCDQTSRSWEGVSTRVRQLVRLVVESGDVVVSIDNANALVDMAIDPHGWRKLSERYRKAALRFRELEEVGDLPKLRIPLKTSRGGPLPVGTRVDPR